MHPSDMQIAGHNGTAPIIGHERFRSLIARHEAFWDRAERNSFLRSTGVFAPSVPIGLPQPDGTVVTQADPLQPDMIDPGALIDEVENWDPRRLDATLRAQGQYLVSLGLGDLMPLTRPLCKIPWIEAMLGCPLRMTEGHIWNEHYPGDPEEVIQRGVNFEHNPWLQLYLEFLRQLQSRLGDRFAVSAQANLRGTSDLAAAVMGVQEACIGWVDQPAFMARLMRVCTDAVLTVVEAAYRVLRPFQNGYASAYAIWAPGPVLHTQADHSTLLSPTMYKEQILPYDLEVIRSCPISIFHIHNEGLRIVPSLIEVPELNAIEVAMDPYPRGERRPYEVKMLQRILEHKLLILHVHLPCVEEGEWLLTQLPKRGLCFDAQLDLSDYEALPAGFPGSETWLLA